MARYAASGFSHLALPIAGGREHEIRLFERDVGTFDRVAAEIALDDPDADMSEYSRRIGVLDLRRRQAS